LDAIIGDNNYVTGDELTIADLSLLASSTVFAIANFDLSDYKNVENWIKRLQNELDYYEEINGDRQAVEDYTNKIREKFTKK
jgi:glutathione S-transferase